MLAAPPGEQHDLGLIMCGLTLSRQGLRVTHIDGDPVSVAIMLAHSTIATSA